MSSGSTMSSGPKSPFEINSLRGKRTTPEKGLLAKSPAVAKTIAALNANDDPDVNMGCQALCRCVVASFKKGEEGEGAIKSLEDLLKAGVSPNPDKNDAETISPLYLAAKLDLVDSVKLLLRYDAYVTHKSNGENAIQVAQRMSNNDVLDVLFTHIHNMERNYESSHIPLVEGDIEPDEDQGSRRSGSASKRKRSGANGSARKKGRKVA